MEEDFEIERSVEDSIEFIALQNNFGDVTLGKHPHKNVILITTTSEINDCMALTGPNIDRLISALQEMKGLL